MSFVRIFLLFIIILSFSSCSRIAENIGFTGLVILSIILLALFATSFYMIFKRRRQADKSLIQFSASLQDMLNKLDSSDKKIKSLQTLIQRINEDKKYKKDETWKNKVLAKTYLHIATIYHNDGDVKNTIASCTKILELTPDDAMTLYNRGSMYLNEEEFQKSLDDLNKSIELVDNYGSSYNNRGMVYSKLGRYDEAIKDFDTAIQLENTPAAYYNRGAAYKEKGDKTKATEDYNQALALCEEEDENLKREITIAKQEL